MKRYVIGDIHGNHKGLVQALERANFDYDNDTLISLGDLVDGHSESYEVIEELYKIKNLLLVKGNHDEWFYQFIETGIHGSQWQQGAMNTARSYISKIVDRELRNPNTGLINLRPDDIPEHHKYLLSQQVPYIIDEDNNLFIHGGFNRHLMLAQQPKHVFWWDRDLWNSALSWKSMTKGMLEEKPKFKMVEDFKEVFIGHTSTQFWDEDTPMNAANIWNIDTGGGWWGKVTLMNVDTKEFYQSDNGKELYPNFKGRE